MAPKRKWEDGEQERYRSLLVPMIGLVAGAIVLLPSILGVVNPPLYWDWLLLTFWGASVSAVLMLGLAWYFSSVRSAGPPDRLHGWGNMLGVSGLVALAVFIGLNAMSDRSSLPSIVSIEASPSWPEPGEPVKLRAVVRDEDRDQLTISWKYDGLTFGRKEIAYWQAPEKAGRYEVEFSVCDDRDEPVTEGVSILVRPQGKPRRLSEDSGH